MLKKLLKTGTQKQIKEFLSDIKSKNPKQIKKIKRLAMKHNIQLKELRKKFCKKCLTPYHNSKIRIKNKVKIVTCNACYYISRYKIK